MAVGSSLYIICLSGFHFVKQGNPDDNKVIYLLRLQHCIAASLMNKHIHCKERHTDILYQVK